MDDVKNTAYYENGVLVSNDAVRQWLSRVTLSWRHNKRDGVSNHQPYHCLLSCLFRRRGEFTGENYVHNVIQLTLTRFSKSMVQRFHNGRDGVSNHQPHHCLLNLLFRRRSKTTSKLRVTGLCEGNSPLTGKFLAQMASNAENVCTWWHHHDHA